MTRSRPPRRFTGTLRYWPLAKGTTLSRVHPAVYDACSFNPNPSELLFGGGRFDATPADPHGYLYAGLTDAGAVSETLLRDIPGNDFGARFLLKKQWEGRQLSRVRTTEELRLIALRTGPDLGAIGQDGWLTTCDPEEYPQSRAWSAWLRACDPRAQGLVWFSKRDPGEEVLVLWRDRCPPAIVEPADGPLPEPCRFDEPAGTSWLREHLAQYRVSIRA